MPISVCVKSTGRLTSGASTDLSRHVCNRSCEVLVSDGEQRPGAGDSFELRPASVFKPDARSCCHVPDCRRHQDLVGVGEGRDSLPDVQRDAADVCTAALDLTGMQAGAHSQSELVCCFAYVTSAQDRSTGRVESRNQFVASSEDLVSAPPIQGVVCFALVLSQQFGPPGVAQGGGEFGRTYDIDEQTGGKDSGLVGGTVIRRRRRLQRGRGA